MRPPGRTSRKGAGLGANKRRAGPGGWRRAPLARAHHPPSGGPMSGAVVRSSARGTWRASGAYPQCPNHPGRWGEPADTTRKPPGGPSQQHRTQILAVETSWHTLLFEAERPDLRLAHMCAMRLGHSNEQEVTLAGRWRQLPLPLGSASSGNAVMHPANAVTHPANMANAVTHPASRANPASALLNGEGGTAGG